MSAFLRFGIAGGNGSTAFDDTTALAQPYAVRLATIRVRSANSIDSIQFIYLDATGREVALPAHGGSGGTERTLALATGERLVRVEGTFGNYVDFLVLTTSGGQTMSFGTYHALGGAAGAAAGGPPTPPPFSPALTNHFLYEAPPEYEIFAIWGNSGTLLDALGVALRLVTPPTPHATVPSRRP